MVKLQHAVVWSCPIVTANTKRVYLGELLPFSIHSFEKQIRRSRLETITCGLGLMHVDWSTKCIASVTGAHCTLSIIDSVATTW